MAQSMSCANGFHMVFSSLVFLYLFLPLVLLGYFSLPRAARNAWLLLASLVFYAWGEQWYVLVLLLTIGFNWLAGLAIERCAGSRHGRSLLIAGVSANLALLVYFKYANFLVGSLDAVLVRCGVAPIGLAPIHLPIGISFFTFQAISYLVDISRTQIRAQPNPLDYAMYKAFFPQLIAGPIVRYKDVAEAVHARRETIDDIATGVGRFIIGLGKKVLIANVVGGAADRIFALPPDELTCELAWLGAVCYALQIYFDFSGYSDMAIGMGRIFGFRFLENFSYPYIATSVRDFWRRWHISLSSWFRDYLYIPLGGNRVGTWRTAVNLIAVFALCGLWHGASWTFLAWGLYHGAYLTLEHFGLEGAMKRLWLPLRHAYALLVVIVGWVLFRSETLAQAGSYLLAMAGLGGARNPEPGDVANGEVVMALVAGLIGCTPALPLLVSKWAERPVGSATHAAAYHCARLGVLAAILYLSTMALTANSYNPFIYFRF
jgi:alginate O-acetyltransferase complex protein AlgI